MLSNISWTDYLIAVALLMTTYYLFVGVRYFSGELKDLLSGKKRLQQPVGISKSVAAEADYQPSEIPVLNTTAFEHTSDDEFDQLDQLIGRLKNVIKDASGRKALAPELKQYLHLVLQEYPAIKNSALRSSINELVVSECEKYGAVSLSEEDVEMLWSAAG